MDRQLDMSLYVDNNIYCSASYHHQI